MTRTELFKGSNIEHPEDVEDEWGMPPQSGVKPIPGFGNTNRLQTDQESESTYQQADESLDHGSETAGENPHLSASSSAEEPSENADIPTGSVPLEPLRTDRILYEFGAFSDFAEKISRAIPPLAEGDPHETVLANLYLSKAREILNNAFLDTPGAAGEEVTALNERQKVLETFWRNMEDFHIGLAQQLGPELVEASPQYKRAIFSLVRAEHEKIERVQHYMQDITAGKVITGLVVDGFRRVFKTSPPELRGDLKIARERQIKESLNRLASVTEYMGDPSRIGNPAWEQSEGLDSVRAAQDELKTTQELMRKIKSQTDDQGLKKRFKAIQEQLNKLRDTAQTSPMRAALGNLCEGIKKFMQTILTKIGFIPEANQGQPTHSAPKL